MEPGKEERQEGRLGMNSVRLQLLQEGPNHPSEESCISQGCASICMVTVYSRWLGASRGKLSSMVMNPAGQWLRPSVNWVPHCWRFEPHICMATTVNFKVRYTYSFNAAPVNVHYLKKLWTCFQKGEVVNSLHNGLTQGFFFSFFFFFPWTKSLKTNFLKIKLQLWGIPSSTLWNQYYKLQ